MIKRLIKNKEHEFLIDDLSSEGVGVAHFRVDEEDKDSRGLAVFIPGALPGEKVLAKITKVQKNCAFALLNEVIAPSQSRITPQCPHYRLCGGCNMAHMTYKAELKFKRKKIEDALHRLGDIDIEVDTIHPSPQTSNYRNKSAFPVSNAGIGMYRARSHDVIALDNCMLQSEIANKTMKLVSNWVSTYSICPYDENTQTGLLRHIFIRTNKSDEFLLCLVVTSFNVPDIEQLIDTITNFSDKCIGIVLNKNKRNTNVILGHEYKTVYGHGCIVDEICGSNFELSVPSFFQINRPQAEFMYNRAIELAGVDSCETAIDLYCGTGTITLALAKKCKTVYGVEIVEAAIQNANVNAQRNCVNNVKFLCSDAGEAANKFSKDGIRPDLICVDPPRRGLDSKTINAIAQMQPDKIIYISCKPSTLARDLAKLMQNNAYTIKNIEAVDMFPRTHHVESIAILAAN